MKNISFAVLVFVFCHNSFAVEDSDLTGICQGLFKLCGFKSKKSPFKMVIQPKYEKVTRFSEGLAAVRKDGLWGFIDLNDRIVIKPQFDSAGVFVGGLASVLAGKKVGIINKFGNFVIKPQFAFAIPVNHNTIIAQPGSYKQSESPRSTRLAETGQMLALTSPAGLYRIGKGWITQQKYKFSWFSQSSHNYLWAKKAGVHELFGLMSLDGKWKISPVYNHVERLQQGTAPVSITKGGKRAWGAYNNNVKMVIPLKYDYLNVRPDGFIVARLNKKKAIVGVDGQIRKPIWFDQIDTGDDKNFVRVKDQSGWHGYSKTGEFTVDPGDYLQRITKKIKQKRKNEDKAEAKIELTKLHCGKEILLFSKSSSNPLFSRKWGLKRADGAVLVPAKYRATSCFKNGIAWVSSDIKKKWCPVNTRGKEVTKPDCKAVIYFQEITHHFPEQMNADPYENSVLWNRALLDYYGGHRAKGPKFIGDGVKGHGEVTAK